MNTQIGYVVLYVKSAEEIAEFWKKYFDFEVKGTQIAGEHEVITIGAKNSQTNFELVPLALMENNPYDLNLKTPSICLSANDIELEHDRLSKLGANITEIQVMGERKSFAIIDPEGNAFAIA